ncbi:hypothetical protein [Lysobacter auxotrophicus]|nr:hypothetical protein [Lysobacter auxotrophicus]
MAAFSVKVDCDRDVPGSATAIALITAVVRKRRRSYGMASSLAMGR